jgi:cell wall-associated NlpC family hydrolase
MIFKRSLYLFLCFIFLSVFASAQGRARVVKLTSSQPTNQPQKPTDKTKSTNLSQPVTNPSQRPTLENKLVVQNQPSLVKKTADIKPTNISATSAGRLFYNSSLNRSLVGSIQNKLGIPYRYGSEGPNRYDCSGFVWSVFTEAGILFERSSAGSYWANFEPVYGDDRYKFGTLVFFNRLGHVGIVADEKGFYHASSSKGITYSPFEGYWEKRIVGFRRIPTSLAKN